MEVDGGVGRRWTEALPVGRDSIPGCLTRVSSQRGMRGAASDATWLTGGSDEKATDWSILLALLYTSWSNGARSRRSRIARLTVTGRGSRDPRLLQWLSAAESIKIVVIAWFPVGVFASFPCPDLDFSIIDPQWRQMVRLHLRCGIEPHSRQYGPHRTIACRYKRNASSSREDSISVFDYASDDRDAVPPLVLPFQFSMRLARNITRRNLRHLRRNWARFDAIASLEVAFWTTFVLAQTTATHHSSIVIEVPKLQSQTLRDLHVLRDSDPKV
ncbi:hypothetical protein EI94DRAFT_1706377 [Lactarius quietus]|nr:hypothetical protein EI94DRAFT_1706377 [Lactarius quietus]